MDFWWYIIAIPELNLHMLVSIMSFYPPGVHATFMPKSFVSFSAFIGVDIFFLVSSCLLNHLLSLRGFLQAMKFTEVLKSKDGFESNNF